MFSHHKSIWSLLRSRSERSKRPRSCLFPASSTLGHSLTRLREFSLCFRSVAAVSPLSREPEPSAGTTPRLYDYGCMRERSYHLVSFGGALSEDVCRLRRDSFTVFPTNKQKRFKFYTHPLISRSGSTKIVHARLFGLSALFYSLAEHHPSSGQVRAKP